MNKTYDPLASVQAAGPPESISFIYGLPDPETFPKNDLLNSFKQVFQEKASVALQYAPEQGYGPLIDYLRNKILQSDGITIERPQIKLTGGASQALDHLCTLFTRSGDIVLTEAPTYRDSLQLFRNHGLKPLQISIDDEGLNVEEFTACLESLKKQGKQPRFLYTIPSFQNPSGITLSKRRRKTILDITEKFNLLVIEDDVYCDLAYEEFNVPSLFAMDKTNHVVRLGSFSKIIAPGLRLGWMIGPKGTIDELINSGLRCMGGGANPFTANAVAIYCHKGLLEPHIEFIRSIYRKRRDVMLESLKLYMPEGVHWTEPGGGFFIWVTLPQPLRAIDVVKWVKKERILILGGDPFFAEPPLEQHLRLAFSYVPPHKIQEGIKKLADILKSQL